LGGPGNIVFSQKDTLRDKQDLSRGKNLMDQGMVGSISTDIAAPQYRLLALVLKQFEKQNKDSLINLKK